jgi:hypothetical protein
MALETKCALRTCSELDVAEEVWLSEHLGKKTAKV